jgi:vacuolar-type H+-ATPase subunit I/STV1
MGVDSGDFMRIAIGVFFLLFGVGLIYMLLRLAGVFGAAGVMVQDVDREIVPVLNKLQTTMDEVNAELGTVGEMTQSANTAVGAVEHTTVAVTHAIGGPVKTLAGVAAGVGRAVNTLFQPKHKEVV